MNQEEVTVTLEVNLFNNHHSFEVTVKPGSYVSELISEALEQCGVTGIPPQRCQMLLVSETEATPLEDEDLFNSLSAVDEDYESLKLVLKYVEQDPCILNVYFHNGEDHRIKYSFVVDETTTVDLINAAMAEKLHLIHETDLYKLINCIPGGQEHELDSGDIPLLLNTHYLEFRVFEKKPISLPPVPPSDKKPGVACNHSLKQLKNLTSKKACSLPTPPKALSDFSPSGTFFSLPSPKLRGKDHPLDDEVLRSTIEKQKRTITQLQDMVNTLEREKELCVEKIQHQSFVIRQLSAEVETKVVTEHNRWKKIVFEKDSKIAQQQILIGTLTVGQNVPSIKSGHSSQKHHHKNIEDELQKLHNSLQIKNEQIDRLQSDLKCATDLVADKQSAIDTLSDILKNEQEENDRLQNKALQHTSTLYQDLFGRIALTVEVERPSSTSSCGFLYEEVADPISSGPYITVKQLERPIESLQAGDIILEVNGHSCKALDTTMAVQSLENSLGKLKLVVARSCPEVLSSTLNPGEYLDFDTKLPPLPMVPIPENDFTSSTSLDQDLGNILGETRGSKNSLHEGQFATKFSELEKECDQLKQAIEDGEVAMEILRNELQTLRMEKEEALVQVTELQNSLKSERGGRESLVAKVKEGEKTNAKLVQDLLEHEQRLELQARSNDRQKDQLSLQLSKLRTDHETLQKKFRSVTTALEEETTKYQNKISVTQKAGKQKEGELSVMLKEAEFQIEEVKSKSQVMTETKPQDELIEAGDEEMGKFQKRVSILEAELRDQALAHKEGNETLESEKSQIIKKLETSVQELQEIKRDLEAARIHVAEKENLVRERDKQIVNLQSTINVLKSNDELTKTKAEIEESRNRFQERVAELEAEMRDRDLIHKEAAEKMEKENSKIKEKLVSSTEEVQEIKKDLEAAAAKKENFVKERDNQILKLHSAIEDLNSQVESLNNQIKEEKEQQLQHSERAKAANSRLTDLESKHKKSSEQQEAVQKKEKELEKTQKEAMMYKEKAKLLESEKRIQQETMATMESDLQSSKQQVEKKDAIIAGKDSQIAELHSTMKEQNSELRLLQKQVLDEHDRASDQSEKHKATEKKLMESEKINQGLLSFESELGRMTGENSKLKEDRENLRSDLEELKKACEVQRNSFTLERQSLEQTVENVKAELDLCKQQLASNQHEASLYKEKAESLLSTMEKDLQSTKQQSEKRDNTVTEKDSQIIKLYSTVDQLNSEFQALQVQLKEERDQGSNLSHALKIANGKIESMKANQENSDSLIKKLETDTMNETEEVNRLQKETSALQSSVEELRASKQALEEKCENLKREAEMNSNNFKDAKSRLESEVKSYEDKNKAIKADKDGLSRDLDEEKKTSEHLRKELAELMKSSDLETTNFEKIKGDMENKIKTLEQHLNTSQSELATQREHHASLESKTNTLYEQLGYVKAEKEKLDEKLTNVKKEHEKLEKEYEVAESESKVKLNSLQQLLIEKERELEAKQKLLNSCEESIKTLEAEKSPLEERLIQHTKEAEEELRQVKAKLQAEADEARKNVESLKGEVNELQRNNMELSESLRHSERTAGSLTERNESMKENLDKLNAQYASLEREKQIITDSYEEEKNVRVTLERKVSKLEKGKEKLQRESEAEMKKAEVEIKKLQDDLKRELAKSETEVEKLSTQLTQSREQVDRKEKEIESLNLYVAKLLPVVMEYKPSILSVEKEKYPSMPY